MDYEYQSILCAALLHDIGKFWQCPSNSDIEHRSASEAFIDKFAGSFYNPELVKELVGHHHESAQHTPAEHTPSTLTDQHTRCLAYLISRADSQASGERPDSQIQDFKPLSALDSVFCQVDLGKPLPQNPWRYPLSAMFEEAIRPKSDLDQHTQQQYSEYYRKFETEFAKQFTTPYLNMADSLLSLIQKYLWCIPSDTTNTMRDISLADHMKITCAIAACMYKYHDESSWSESAVKDDSCVKYRLVCGDVTGIQNYIYGIASVGHGGVAKRLRGRSFSIAMLTEAASLKIIRDLDLPAACKIMSAGGQFYLLIPNTQSSMQTLRSASDSINDWLLHRYNGDLGIIVDSIELPSERLMHQSFDGALSDINVKIAMAKQRKFVNVIQQGPKVFEMEFRGRPICPVCGKNPASNAKEEPDPCPDCKSDEEIGKALTDKQDIYLIFTDMPIGGDVCKFGLFDDWTAVITSKPANIDDPIMVYNLRGSRLVKGRACGFLPLAGYVPRWSGDQEYQEAPESSREESYDQDYLNSGRAIKDFSALANESEGNKLLGVLRADVDHMGLVFSLGMKGKASLSRISTLSSMLSAFFSYELVKMLADKYSSVYTAYTGGDDLMLLGPWDQIIDVSRQIQQEFQAYSAYNPNITISAGIGTFKPVVPIATTSVITGEILERSKANGRDNLTLFGTSIRWADYDKVRAWETLFCKALCDPNDPMSSSFLYRLFAYQEQARDYIQNKNPRSVMYRPHLAYDIARNFRNPDGEPKTDPVLLNKLMELIGADQEEWMLLKPAITWSAYENRKG